MNRALDELSSCFAARIVSNRSRVCSGKRSPEVAYGSLAAVRRSPAIGAL